jgi:hypothetical protein
MKRFLVLLGVVLISSSLPLIPSSAEAIDPDAPFFLPDDGRAGLMGAFFNDQVTGEKTSHLIDSIKWQNNQIDPTCTSIQDPSCTSNTLEFRSIIPFCQSDTDINCVEEVGAIKEDGTKVAAKFKQYFPLKAQNEFLGDASYQLPSGKAGSLVSMPGITHKGGEEFLVTVQLNGSVDKVNRKTRLDGFLARIVPVQLVDIKTWSPSSCPPEVCDVGWVYHDPLKRWAEVGSGGPTCEATSARTTQCAEKRAFPPNLRFYLKTRLNVSPSGWLHGRFAEPEVSIEAKEGITRIAVEALPVRVPILFKSYLWAEAPEAIKAGYNPSTGFFKLGNIHGAYRIADSDKETDPTKRNFISTPLPSGKTGIEELKLWLPILEDKATAMASIWSIRTLRQEETEGANPCFDSKTELTGLVTTNATQYSAGPPAFDKAEGTLTYQVGAPHFTPTGEVFKGRYNLSMRSEVARCVYQFSKAPIRAELSVVSAEGSPQVATTVVSEKNGWVYLSAANFEFSTPVIKAKLTQEVVVEPTPTPTAVATAKPAQKKITITCAKGKTTKKVTAVKPKCPSGFKKK